MAGLLDAVEVFNRSVLNGNHDGSSEVFPPHGDALPDDGSIVGTSQAGEADEQPGNHVAEELPEELAQFVHERLACH